MTLTDADRAHIPEFVAVVGEALEDCPNAETGVTVLYGACADVVNARGSEFIPLGTFTRLLIATGYWRTSRRYGRRFAGIRPKDPALAHKVWLWDN